MRHRAGKGGRGSAKSHSFGTGLVLRGAGMRWDDVQGCLTGGGPPLRILCTREIQNSMKASVKRLLDDKIRSAGLGCGNGSFYQSTENSIVGPSDGAGIRTEFSFAGLRTNIDSVKSTEGIDICWVEEARTVSASSIKMLTPTIRKDGSEIWWTWNPKNPTDPVDNFFCSAAGAPPGSIVRHINYDQNPFFPGVLARELEWARGRDPDDFAWVWLGAYLKASSARVFRNWKVEDFETPPDATFYLGADWGFAVDPSVLVRCFVVGRTLYIDQEAYMVGCEIDDSPKLFAGRAGATEEERRNWSEIDDANWPGIPDAKKWIITADSSSPQTISYMRRQGFRMSPAVKGPGSIEEGIKFLKSYDIVVHPRCVHTIDELTLYSYKVDPLTEMILPILEDKRNHVIDSLRYAVEKLRSFSGGEGIFEFMRQEAERAAAAGRATIGASGLLQITDTSDPGADQDDWIDLIPPGAISIAYDGDGREYRKGPDGTIRMPPGEAQRLRGKGWKLATPNS